MALPVREQFKYWGIAAVVLFVLLWVLGNQLLRNGADGVTVMGPGKPLLRGNVASHNARNTPRMLWASTTPTTLPSSSMFTLAP